MKKSTTKKVTKVVYNELEKQFRTKVANYEKSNVNIDYKGSEIGLIVLELLKGKERKDYPKYKKHLKEGLKLTNHSNNVINKFFKYKELKIISNVNLLPFTTINSLINVVIANEGKKELLKELKELHSKDDTKESYKVKIINFIEKHTIKHEVKINIEKEAIKLKEQLTKEQILELITLLNK